MTDTGQRKARWTEGDERKYQALHQRREAMLALVMQPWFRRVIAAALAAGDE